MQFDNVAKLGSVAELGSVTDIDCGTGLGCVNNSISTTELGCVAKKCD